MERNLAYSSKACFLTTGLPAHKNLVFSFSIDNGLNEAVDITCVRVQWCVTVIDDCKSDDPHWKIIFWPLVTAVTVHTSDLNR